MLQLQDGVFSNFFSGCTPGVAVLTRFTKYPLGTVL